MGGIDLVDQPPCEGRGRIDRLAGEAEQGGAVPADSTGQAHGAARSRDEPERHLGEPEGRVRGGHDASREGRQLHAGPAAGAVHVGDDALGDGVDRRCAKSRAEWVS